jgi:WD40 repeat protein
LEFENHQGKKIFNLKYKFGQNLHASDFLDVFYINNEENVVSIAKGKDTKIKVWTLKGEQLFEFNTSGGEHFCCTSLFDLNLVFVGCWTSDIKVVELKKGKDKKSVKSFEKIHSLVGHQSEIHDLQTSEDGKRVICVCKKGEVTLWNLEVK